MVYLITGASSGIGRATAVWLAERGHYVIAGVRRVVDAPSHRRIRAVVLDVTDADQIAVVAKEVDQLDGLVNIAGVTVAGPMEHLPLDRFRRQLEVNVVGLVAVTQAFLPAIRAGRGRIVMMSSAAGRVAPPPLLGAVGASKFAVEAVADAFRRELRRWRIPVVVIEPGSFKSRSRDSINAAVKADRADMSVAAQERYGPAMDALIEFNTRIEARAGDPERVAAVIERALTSRRPRTRYVVGADARTIIALGTLLPARALDALLCKLIAPKE